VDALALIHPTGWSIFLPDALRLSGLLKNRVLASPIVGRISETHPPIDPTTLFFHVLVDALTLIHPTGCVR
jgi:hypothetical protein